MIKSNSVVLVLGATSDIGLASAREFATMGHSLVLAARQSVRLQIDAEDIRIRSQVEVTVIEWDVLAVDGGYEILKSLPALPDIAICVVGLLGEQLESEKTPEIAERAMRTNYVGPALVLGELANRMEERQSGTIIGISSVAGDRGRASNYIYGAAKAGFTAFLSGLRNRLAKKNVYVITVKPGFVDTRMTAGMNLPKALTAQPSEVAKAIASAARRGKDVVYVRPIWRLIMLIIRSIPEKIFKKLEL